MIVLNSLTDDGAGFKVDTNKITILTDKGETIAYPLKSKKEVAEDFRQWLFDCGIEKIIPIAHNLDFDMRFIFRTFPAESKVFSRHGRDSMRLALAVNDIFRRETGEDKFPSVSLRAVKDILNISGESCHHALEDAKDAAHAYRKLTDLLTQA